MRLSASDLVGHLSCRHLTDLDYQVANGTHAKPFVWDDPLLDTLRQRGFRHEQGYIDHLRMDGFDALRIDDAPSDDSQAAQTIAAMKSAAEVIVQGVLMNDQWMGRTDILRRVQAPSALGDWSYEVIDTKLARETKGGTVLQLCLYSDLLSQIQGWAPEHMYVVVPWSDFEPERFRTDDYMAYYRFVRRSLEASVATDPDGETYPEPNEHCDVCRWRLQCDARRRADDHLCLVAGASTLQIDELRSRAVNTVAGLACVPLPLPWKPDRGAAQTYERIREQARIQVEGRETGQPVYELLEPEPGFGLARLPEPSKGDVFFDLEGDPFVGEHGIEYLFGYAVLGEDGDMQYTGDWCLSREDEKRAFERFVDFVIDRRQRYPDLHIFHFAPYEPSALKRLMGRYASREDEVDRMLRAQVFVDLFGVVRRGLRASVESYSIKRLEPFYGFERSVELPSANRALAYLQACLELGDAEGIDDEGKAVVEGYNRDDCFSTRHLRDWLEVLRSELIESGAVVDRATPAEAAPREALGEWQMRIDALVERLSADVPANIEQRTQEQQARWILANIADWHRREEKSAWWEYFRLSELSAEDLVDERNAVSGLSFVEEAGGTAKAPIHRYGFPTQETRVRAGDSLKSAGGDSYGSVAAISVQDRTIDVKKRGDSADLHAEAVFAHDMVNSKVLAESLVGVAEHVADSGIGGGGDHQAGRDLLLREYPRIHGEPIQIPDEPVLEAALRIAPKLNGGVLPIQGPPGAGKTYTGARMICTLVEHGARVGITANSHKVIRNLIDEVLRAADERDVDLSCIQKVAQREDDQNRLLFTTDNGEVFDALGSTCQVAGGTAWMWARPEAAQSVDVLFVDEAAQMSLANVLAVSPAGRSLVLLGDPRQLDQPVQGSHPDDTAVSALDHIPQGHQTIGPDQGLFLDETWRLHPGICDFTSEVFYEDRLRSRPGLDRQRVVATGPIQGYGLRYVPVWHNGNQSASPEEADRVSAIVRNLLAEGASWIDRMGTERALRLEDILIITPYNAQVFEIQDRLPDARVGTVDKFQGQETPIAIYSMATSTPAEAPHGMEFLYSPNRLNVATSRARCVSVLVGSPALFEPECRTPRQMQLANAFCRYREMAETVEG